METKDGVAAMFSKRLATTQKAKKLTKLSLTEAMQVSDDTVARWEKGTKTPRLEKIEKLAEILNVPTAYFIGEGGQCIAHGHSIANINGTIHQKNGTFEPSCIKLEIGDGATKLVLTFPPATPGDTIAQAIAAAKKGA